MTMGLPCDSDGYDLRTPQCKQCGSRGCPKKHYCKRDDITSYSINFSKDGCSARAVYQSGQVRSIPFEDAMKQLNRPTRTLTATNTGERRMSETIEDVPLPGRKELEKAIAAALAGTMDEVDSAELLEGAKWALHAIPPDLDFLDVTSRCPINQVFFRAGLLACREYMARFVQAESPTIANSIRQNWWPSLGDDPGAPRLLDFNEVCEETPPDEFGTSKYKSKDIGPSVEALPRAFQFLAASGA